MKLCKCGAKLAMRNGLPINKLCPSCRKAKKLQKIEKHKTTKAGQSEQAKKLMRENDKLYQEIGHLKYKTCYFGHSYTCLHHFVRKSQSLYLRYDYENGIPICNDCHCSIHQAQNSTLEAQIVLDKGREWLNKMIAGKRIIVTDKLEFLSKVNQDLKLIKEQYENSS